MKLCFLAAADNTHSYRWFHCFASHGHEVAWVSLVTGTFERASGVKITVRAMVASLPLAVLDQVAGPTPARVLLGAGVSLALYLSLDLARRDSLTRWMLRR
jgi:hypothetical protein